MRYNYTFDTSSEALHVLLWDLMHSAPEVPSRNGNTKELRFTSITLTEPWKRELLVPERKPNLAAQIAETMWVLAGRNDVQWLSAYLPRAADFSDDGIVWRGGYGPRIRHWNGVDQLAHVVHLLQANKDDRRAIITIYDPTVDSQPGKDIPCNNWLHFLVRENKLDLHVAIRSNDVMWGWSGINAFEWSALQEIVAGLVGVEVGHLHFSVSSMHLYEQHWDKANTINNWTGVYETGTRLTTPRFDPNQSRGVIYFDELIKSWFDIEASIRSGQAMTIAIEAFPEPMMRSWLWVLAWWWSADEKYLDHLAGTRLHAAAKMAMQPKREDPRLQTLTADEIRIDTGLTSRFVAYVDALHRDKHQAYGNSWKRRGEMLGILANIARKIDRLGTNSADETSADTAIDLLVYLCKYRWWLVDEAGASIPTAVASGGPVGLFSDHTEPMLWLLNQLERSNMRAFDSASLERTLTSTFEVLERTDQAGRVQIVDLLLIDAFRLAQLLWKP